MKISKVKVVPLAALLLGSASFAYAQEVRIDAFQPPMPVTMVNPDYPVVALDEGEEGLVELNMMIDTNGKPFEIKASNSVGGRRFEEAALAAMEDWVFQPAMMNGEPIVGSHRTILRFLIEGNTGARQQFVRRHRKFNELLEQGTQEEAAAQLRILEDAADYNHYENAFLNLSRYAYARKYGTVLERMKHLEAALSFSTVKEDVTYLPAESARDARRELMNLQVQNQYYAEARDTYEYFVKSQDTEAQSLFKSIMDQIQLLEGDDRSYAIAATVDENGSFFLDLLKHRIHYTGGTGAIREFKLRCAQKYVGLVVEPDVVYDIPKEWGACGLEVVGDAGSTLSLVQQ